MTPRFRFRLDRVLALREHEEDQAREGYAARLLDEQEARDGVDAAARRIADAGATQREVIASAVSGSDLRAAQAWRERTELARREAAGRLARVQVELARAHEDLVSAHRDRRALAMLRDRRLDAHRRELGRREAAILDDMAARRTGSVAA